jgi:hypothetical protein
MSLPKPPTHHLTNLEYFAQLVEKLQMKKAIPAHYKEPEQVYMALMKGDELGFAGPATSIEAFIPINGNLTLREPVANALLLKHNIYINVIKDCQAEYKTDKDGASKIHDFVTTLEMVRPTIINNQIHERKQTATFTLRDAQTAGLSERDVWKKWPKQMLYWRCFGLLADRMASDILLGLKTTQQLHHLDDKLEITFNNNTPEYTYQTNSDFELEDTN